VSSLTTTSAAFVLAGAIALVLALLSDDARLELGGVAAVSGALALGLLTLGRSHDEPPEDERGEVLGDAQDPISDGGRAS
jgi:hypothetical protein